MKQYRTVNNLMGWVTFLIAATVYCMTIEPTASFWDCGEFITSGYKLEVGHPPGAPFFMMVANLFSQFASDATEVAKMECQLNPSVPEGGGQPYGVFDSDKLPTEWKQYKLPAPPQEEDDSEEQA